jgi:hypothetical protein
LIRNLKIWNQNEKVIKHTILYKTGLKKKTNLQSGSERSEKKKLIKEKNQIKKKSA